MLRHIARAVLVILFVLVARMVLFVAFDVNLDNPLAPLLGSYGRTYIHAEPVPGTSDSHGTPLPFRTRIVKNEWYILSDRNFAEGIGSTTGIIAWVFFPSLLYALCLGRYRRVTRCRECGGILKNLSSPACNHCGEAI